MAGTPAACNWWHEVFYSAGHHRRPWRWPPAAPEPEHGINHGTAAPLFLTGGAVRGGLHGHAAELSRLDAAQNLVFTTDFRQLYASIARDWWGVNPETVVRGLFEPLRLLKT